MARATFGSSSTATAGSKRITSQTDVNELPMEPAIGTERRAGDRPDRDAERYHQGQSVAHESRPLRLVAARFQRRRQCSGGSRSDVASIRRRWSRSHSSGVAAWRRRLPCAEGDGHYARRSSPQRRTQRLRGARSDSHSHGGRGIAASTRRHRASHARLFSRRTRPCPPVTTASTPI